MFISILNYHNTSQTRKKRFKISSWGKYTDGNFSGLEKIPDSIWLIGSSFFRTRDENLTGVGTVTRKTLHMLNGQRHSALTLCQDGCGGRVLSGWNGINDSTKPSKIPITCLIPRVGAGDGAILMWTYYSAFTVPLNCVDDLSSIQRWVGDEFWVGERHGWQYQDVQDPNYMSNSRF